MVVNVLDGIASGSVAEEGVMNVEVDDAMVRRNAVPADRRVEVTEETLLIDSLLSMPVSINTSRRREEVQSSPG